MPPSGEKGDTPIVPADIRALEPLYFAVMLEEAGLFRVVERIVTLFSQGLLPLSTGPAAEILYRCWKPCHNRLTAVQRHTAYALAFGLPCADEEVVSNREFNDLWLRFLPTLGMYAAEMQLPAAERSVTQEEVRRSGRELAVNLLNHGRGITACAAHDLKQEVHKLMRLLAAPEIASAFGGGDAWQVIERVAVSEESRKPNVKRSRTRAESGRIIIRWLANHAKALLRPAPARILRDDDIRQRRSAASEDRKRSHPTDYDLVQACEQWLVVTGTQEALLVE